MADASDAWITMTELRRHFHRVLREVERGTTFTIIRRRRPVARLVPYRGIEEEPVSDRAEPTVPLFESHLDDLALRAEDHLSGFGKQ
jgi:prevent-host-death family protein